MRTSHPYSVLHLHSEGATAITHKARPDGTLAPHFFYQSPKATGSLEMALKRFFEESAKDCLYINVVSETPTLKSFKDTALLKETDAFSQVLEAHSGIPVKDCDAVFLNGKNGGECDGNGPLLVNCFKRSDFLRGQAISSELGFQNFELFNNTLSTLGALSDWRNEFGSEETVAILEVGATSSVATVALSDGQILSKQIPVSIQNLAESIQKKLDLKFESAALLLFYNGVFDFSQHQADISAAFGEQLNPHIQNIAGQLGSEVNRLLIASLPPSYAWINEEVPQSIDLKGFSAEEFYFLKDLPSLGDCANNTGFIGTAFCVHTESESHPWMQPLQMQSIEVACKLYQGFASSPSAAPAQAPEPTPAPIPEPVQTFEQEPPIPQEPQQPVEPVAAEEPDSVESVQSFEIEEEEAPVIEISDLEDNHSIEAEESFDPYEPDPVAPSTAKDIFGDSDVQEIVIEEEEEAPIEVINYDEPDSIEEPPAPMPQAAASPKAEEEEDEKKRKLFPIIIGVAALLILGAGAFFFFYEEEVAPAPVPLPSDVAVASEEPAPDFTEPVLIAQEEEPRHPLSPTPREEEVVEDTVDLFEVAEAETPVEETFVPEPVEPILPLGSLALETSPTGATIFVNGEEKGTTPSTIDELQFGQYSIEYKLDGYVDELITVTVDSEEQESVVTDLKLPLGTLEIHTTPEGVDFKVVSIAGLDRVIHSGTTPASIPEVLEGQYDVQFTRATWEDYSESVIVRHAETARVDLVYPEGWVMISSVPSGASVIEKGQFIGNTPLRLKGLKEGTKHYTLRKEGFEDLEMSTKVVAQTEKNLEGELLSWDREVNYSQLDIPPTQIKRGLSNTQRLVGNNSHRFLVEFVINQEGVPEQIEVLETTYLRAHERLLKDISKWTFEPGMRKDHAVKTRVRLPIILGDVSKLPPTVELARAEQEEE